jgi:hypothetical protein
VRLNLDEIIEHEARCAEQANPVAMSHVELDRAVRLEFDGVSREVVAHKTIADLAAFRGHARHKKRTAREEDQPPFRSQQPVGFRQPSARVAPEARTVLRDRQVETLVVERHQLGIPGHERKGQPRLALECIGSVKLGRRNIDGDGAEPTSHEPRRDGGRAASEFDCVFARSEAIEEAECRLSRGPEPPAELVRVPCASAGGDVAGSPAIPGGLVTREIVDRGFCGTSETLDVNRRLIRRREQLAELSAVLLHSSNGIARAASALQATSLSHKRHLCRSSERPSKPMTSDVTLLRDGSAACRPAEIVSPELALVDPVTADYARAWHPAPGDTLQRIEMLIQARQLAASRRAQTQVAIPAPSAREHARPRVTRRRGRSSVLAGGVIAGIVGAALLVGVRVDVSGNQAGADTIAVAPQPTTTPVVVPPNHLTKPRANQPTKGRAGRPPTTLPAPASRREPRRFAWAPTQGASGYHVELFRGDTRVFAADTNEPQIAVPAHWTLNGRRRALSPGEYRWFVWPVVSGLRASSATVQATLTITD